MEGKDIFSIILLIVFFLVGTVKYLRNYSFSKISLLLFAVYLFSAIGSLLYYCNPLFIQQHKITIFPYLYWCFIFFVLLIPIVKYDNIERTNFYFNPKTIECLGIVALLFSIAPFLESLKMLSTMSLNTMNIEDTFSELHDNDEKITENLSMLSHYSWAVISILYDLIEVSLIPMMMMYKRINKLAILGVGLMIVTQILLTILAGSRGNIVYTMFQLILIVFIAFPIMPKDSKKNLMKIVLLAFSCVLSVFVIITISRSMVYSENRLDFSMYYFIVHYVGEGFLNFNQYFYSIENYLDGQYLFYDIRSLLGLHNMELFRNSNVENITGVPSQVFYTFLGFFVMDIGPIFTVILCLIVSFVVTKLIRKRQTLYISDVYLIFLFSSIVLEGTCLYVYCGGKCIFLLRKILLYLIVLLFEQLLLKKRYAKI